MEKSWVKQNEAHGFTLGQHGGLLYNLAVKSLTLLPLEVGPLSPPLGSETDRYGGNDYVTSEAGILGPHV